MNFEKGEVLEEWEVPVEFPAEWSELARAPFEAFHAARQAMQVEMDRSVAAHAEPETLYDKPEVDKNRLRITGPFSVEAVPSPTVLSLDVAQSPAEADISIARTGETSRQAMWRDELMKTGIRGKGGAMLRLAGIEAMPGLQYLHASAMLADAGGKTLALEIKGTDSPQNQAKRDALSEWAAAVNEAGGFGPWCWDVAFEPARVHDIIAKHSAGQ